MDIGQRLLSGWSATIDNAWLVGTWIGWLIGYCCYKWGEKWQMYNIFAKEEDQLVHSVNVIPPTSPPGPLSLQPTQLIPYSLPLIIFNIYTEQYTHSSKYFRKFQCKYLSTAVRRSYHLTAGVVVVLKTIYFLEQISASYALRNVNIGPQYFFQTFLLFLFRYIISLLKSKWFS